MTERDLKKRTKDFAIRIIHLVEALPNGRICDGKGKQVLRAGTSVGANYRAAFEQDQTLTSFLKWEL